MYYINLNIAYFISFFLQLFAPLIFQKNNHNHVNNINIYILFIKQELYYNLKDILMFHFRN